MKALAVCSEFYCCECPYQHLDSKEYDLRCIHTLVSDTHELLKKMDKNNILWRKIMEFKFENKSIRNIDVMKKDLANYIFGMNEDELYLFIGYLEHEDLKLPKSIFTCERCAALNGNDCDIECCEERFKKYCYEEYRHEK